MLLHRGTGGRKKEVQHEGDVKETERDHEQRFKSAFESSKDMATNRGFRMNNGRMVTYEQQKLGLSAYYDKRWVLEDGIHTEPIEFHC